MDKMILTKEGYDELVAEIENRKTFVRNEIADEIDRARQQGDLSENAAYKTAMEKKEFNEVAILNLEEMIQNSLIQENKPNKAGIIQMGSKVKLLDEKTGLNKEFMLVGESESDPTSGKISVKSPLGAALLNKRIEESVDFTTPVSKVSYKIVGIK